MWHAQLREWLEARMAERGLHTARELAAALGVANTAVLGWLKGADTPSLRSCEKLAAYFGRSLDEVLEVSGRRQAQAPLPRNVVFGGWLVERMRSLGIGTGAMARRLGLSETTIYNWRQGTRTPD